MRRRLLLAFTACQCSIYLNSQHSSCCLDCRWGRRCLALSLSIVPTSRLHRMQTSYDYKYLPHLRLVGIVDFTAHNMMTSDEVQPNLTQSDRRVRSIDEAFEAFTPVPSVLLDSALCIIRVSASYLAFNHLTSHECVGLNIYDLVAAKTLSPGPAALQVVLDNAIAGKKRLRPSRDNQLAD